MGSPRRTFRASLLQVAVFAAHLSVTIIGMRTGASNITEPLVWLPIGVALGAFLIGGLRFLPAVLFSSVIGMQWLEGLTLAGRLATALSGTAAPAMAAMFLVRYARFQPELERVRDLAWLLVVGIPLASALNAVGVTIAFLCCGDLEIDPTPFWASWALAGTVGSTILTPTALLGWAIPQRPLRLLQWAELATLVTCLTVACMSAIFLATDRPVLAPLAAIATLPLAITISLRFDRLGAAATGLVGSVVLLVAAVTGNGPFDPMLSSERLHALLGLWGFVLALQAMATLLGVSVAANNRQTAEIATVAARLRQVVDAAKLGSWQFDRARRTTHANPRFATMLGTAEALMVGRTVREVVSERQREEACRRIEQAIARGAGDVELECARDDGGIAWLQLHVTALADGGAIAAVEDLAERRREEAERLRLETNILHAQRLESLGVLSGGVAHDFNNIVMGIRGNAGLLRIRDAANELTRECTDRIDAACERAAALVATLLAYAGCGPFAIERLSLDRSVREAVESARIATPRGGRIVLLESDQDLQLDADPNHLRQLLLAVISNAAEGLAPSGGIVQVGCKALPVERREQTSVAMAEISVTDDGCGMDAATVERVFEPFFSTKGLGRGLGMSAALGIAKRLGGSIEIDSRVNGGTTVRIVLPIVGTHENGAHRNDMTPLVPSRRPIAVVVEPEVSVRDLIVAVLQIRGFSVREERTLERALSVTSQQPAALIVADGGRSVSHTLDCVRQARHAGLAVPLVLTTEGRDTLVLHPEDPQTVWISRPFGVRDFLDAVDATQRTHTVA